MFEPPLPNAGSPPTITTVDPAFPHITGLVLLGILVILVLWEAQTLRRSDDKYATITSTVRYWTYKWPLLPFLAGVLVGHFWW